MAPGIAGPAAAPYARTVLNSSRSRDITFALVVVGLRVGGFAAHHGMFVSEGSGMG
jgi:hypothetical protein